MKKVLNQDQDVWAYTFKLFWKIKKIYNNFQFC